MKNGEGKILECVKNNKIKNLVYITSDFLQNFIINCGGAMHVVMKDLKSMRVRYTHFKIK